VAGYAVAGAEIFGNDPAAARAVAGRIWDRTPGMLPAVQMANQLGMVFGRLDCQPRWRERLAELAMTALVVHGRRNPFFPIGNGEALAREIPVHGSSYSNGPRRRSPMRPPVRSRRRC
jgi:pimeloyl-ACP methyl ester carboxylesterase